MRRLHWAARTALFLVVAAVVVAIGHVVGKPAPAPSHVVHRQVAHLDGLGDTQDGFRLVPVQVPASRGTALPVAFRVLGPGGRAETEFQVDQTKQLHFFVVRDDLHAFQHVHPWPAGDTWHASIDVPDGGAYRVYAEFVPKVGGDPAHPVVLSSGFVIPGDTRLVPLPPPSDRAEADGFTVVRTDGAAQPFAGRTSWLRFRILDPTGTPVTDPDPLLGAYGHLTGFNTVMLSVTHLHPVERLGGGLPGGEITFVAQFAQRGEHRLFLEFAVDGRPHTAAVTVFAT